VNVVTQRAFTAARRNAPPDISPAPPTAVTPAAPRDAFFDNAKYIAIVLVVVGHTIEPLRGDAHILRSIYIWIYLFHMPAFIVIAGYFSRRLTLTPDRGFRMFTSLFVPYVIFETAYSVFASVIGHTRLVLSLSDPYFVTWFLLSLACWRLLTPMFRGLRYPLVLAVVVSLTAGLSPTISRQMSLSRTLGLLPFFVFGLVLDQRWLEVLRRPVVRAASVVVLASVGITAWVRAPSTNLEWLFWRRPYSGYPVGPIEGMIGRLLLIVIGLAMVMAFLSLVPRRRMWFTALGGATLYAFLLHGFVVKTVVAAGWYDSIHGMAMFAVLIASAAIVATVLMSPPVRMLARPFVEPKLAWLRRREVVLAD
jgi:fucose 4-O-acetylase-like acetyltransferase